MKITLLSLSLCFIIANSIYSLSFSQTTSEKNHEPLDMAQGIRETILLLTTNESKYLEKFLKQKLANANTQEDKLYYESLLQSFYKGMYDSVIAEIKALGENIQSILHVTGLREDLLAGKLLHEPWFIADIAQLPTKEFSSYKDKLIYLESLLDAFRRAALMSHTDLALQALEQLKKEFQECQENVSGIFEHHAERDLGDIQELLQTYQNK